MKGARVVKQKWLLLVVVVVCLAGLLITGCNGGTTPTGGGTTPGDGGGGGGTTPTAKLVEWEDTWSKQKYSFPENAVVDGMKPGEEKLYFHWRYTGSGTYDTNNNFREKYFEEIAALTKGHMRIDIYGSYMLGNWLDFPYLIGSGVVETGTWAPMYQPTESPLTSVHWQPFAMPYHGDDKMVKDREDSCKLAEWVFYNDKGQAESVKNLNLWSFFSTPNYPGSGLCVAKKVTKPLEKVEDFKGLSSRATGYHSIWAKEMGMQPVYVLCSEVYEGLQKGMFDMTVGGKSSMITARYGEVCDKLIMCGISGNNVADAVNWDKWQELPQYIKDIMLNLRDKWKKYCNDQANGMDAKYHQQMLDKGIKIYMLSPTENAKLRAAGKPAWKSFEAEAAKVGAPIKDVLTGYAKLYKELTGETWDQWP